MLIKLHISNVDTKQDIERDQYGPNKCILLQPVVTPLYYQEIKDIYNFYIHLAHQSILRTAAVQTKDALQLALMTVKIAYPAIKDEAEVLLNEHSYWHPPFYCLCLACGTVKMPLSAFIS